MSSCACIFGFQYEMYSASGSRPARRASSAPRRSSASHGAGSPVSRLCSPIGFSRSPKTTSSIAAYVVAHLSKLPWSGSGDLPALVTNMCAYSVWLARSAAVTGTSIVFSRVANVAVYSRPSSCHSSAAVSLKPLKRSEDDVKTRTSKRSPSLYEFSWCVRARAAAPDAARHAAVTSTSARHVIDGNAFRSPHFPTPYWYQDL